VLTLQTSLPQARYGSQAAMANAFERIERGLDAVPGVRAAGGVTGLPLASTRGDWGLTIEGRPQPAGAAGFAADWQVVTPGYFAAIGTPVRAGRTFTARDTAGAPRVIVVNETMARRFWPGGSVVGRRVRLGGDRDWTTVVGVVEDVRHRGLDKDVRPEMYRPDAQFPYRLSTLTWVIRADRGDPGALAGQARAAIAGVDADLGVSDVRTLEDVVSDSTSDRRLNLMLFALFGGLALALATVGVYGVVAYSVSERTREIGLRMAIGAQQRDVLTMVVGEGVRLAAAGLAIGAALALASARLIRSLLFDISPTDPLTLVSVAALLMAIAAAASYLPARRASAVDPMIALRGE